MLKNNHHISLLTLLFVVLLLPQNGKAQISQEHEFGLWGGGAYYLGDINNSLNELKYTRQGGGVFYRWNWHPRFSLKTGVNYLRLMGADSTSVDIFQQRRNLSFRNDVIGLTSQLEFNFVKPKLSKRNTSYFTPYLFMGLGIFYHSPYAQVNGEWVELRPLGTEGQQFPQISDNNKYGLVSVNVPLGGGLKYIMNKHWAIGLEFSYSKTFTDYIDDISKTYVDPTVLAGGESGSLAVALADRSTEVDQPAIGTPGGQRGDDRRNDSFMYAGFSISYIISELICPTPSGRGFR